MSFVANGQQVAGYNNVMFSVSSSKQAMNSSNSWSGSLNNTRVTTGPVLYNCANSGLTCGTRMITQWKSQPILSSSAELDFSMFDELSSRISEIRSQQFTFRSRYANDGTEFRRDMSEKWAMYEGFCSEQLTEFRYLMKLALAQYIPKSKLTGSVQIDKGSFGKIYRCDYDGTEVAVKEIGQSSEGQCNIKTKMRELLLELRILVQIRHPNVVGFWGTALDFPTSSSQHPSLSLVFENPNNASPRPITLNTIWRNVFRV